MKLRIKSAHIILPCILFMLFSCQKKSTDLVFTQLHSGVTDDINSVLFLDDSTGYACGGMRYESGKILKTIDGGFTWTNQSTADMEKAIYKIAFPSKDTGFACGYDGKIFRTFDGGKEWVLYQTGLWFPLRDIFMLTGKKGFSCGGDGFQSGYRINTTNAGDLWTGDTSQTEFRSICFFNDSVGLLAGYGIILRTVNGGQSWEHTNAQQDFFVSMAFVNDLTGYAVGYTGSILKTSDGGQNWDQLRNSNSLLLPHLFFNQVTFRDENTGYIVGEGGCFLKTDDGGNHWLKIANAPDADLKGISLTSNGGFICGTDGNIFHFIDNP